MGLLVILLINGCGGSSSDPKSESPVDSKSQTRSETLIDGKTPETYYSQFLFQDSSASEGVYRFLGSSQYFAHFADGSHASIYLALYPNHTFKMNYSEDRLIGEGGEIENILSKRLSGNWSVQGTKLILDSLAEGSALTLNDKPGVALKFTKAIGNAELPSKLPVLTMTLSSQNNF
jgi:hypothetical protein